MKKTLHNIFDEANANEIDNLVNQNTVPEVSGETLSSIKNKVYAKTKLKKGTNNNKGTWLRFAAIAACLLLIVSAVIVAPMLREDDPEFGTSIDAETEKEEDGTNEINTPDIDISGNEIIFDSLDKVNFYGGLKAIADSKASLSVTHSKSATASYLLSSNKNSVQILNLSETNSDGISDLQTTDNENTPNSNNAVWDLTHEPMTITTAVYFKINVAEGDTLLASKIGAGEAEVIVTDLCIGINPFAMITFKNGDKYFSCLSEMYALKDGENHFGSHLYISGFEMFKDRVNETTSFYLLNLDKENNTVTSFQWKHYNRIPSQAPLYDIEVFSETINISYNTYVFTLNELRLYWQGENNAVESTVESTNNTLDYDEATEPIEITDQTDIWDNSNGKTYTLLPDDNIITYRNNRILDGERIKETGKMPNKTVTLFGKTHVFNCDETTRSIRWVNNRIEYTAIDALASFDSVTGALMSYTNSNAGINRSYQSEVNDKSDEAEFLAYAKKLVSQYASVEGCEVEISTKIFEYNASYENCYTKMQVDGYVNNAEDAPDFYAIYHITFYKTIDGIRRFDTNVIEINNTGEVHRASFNMQDELYAEIAGVKVDMEQAKRLAKKEWSEFIPDPSTVEFVPSLIATNDGDLWLHFEMFVQFGGGTSGYIYMIRLSDTTNGL